MSTAKKSIIDFIKSYTSENLDIKYEIELIFQDVLNCKKIDLYTNKNLSINNNQGQIIDDYIKRVKSGEPVQYVLSKAPFYGRFFFVTQDVLIPRFDSELIIDILNQHEVCDKLLEIGVGSGNLAVTIAAEQLANEIIATDISQKKLDIAIHNKKNICPNSKIKFIIDDFFNSHLCPNEKFDIIISNPPYIPQHQIVHLDNSVKNHEPIDALTDGYDGFNFYKQFALAGNDLLKENGFMLLEIGVDNDLKSLYDIFSMYDFKVYKDINKIPRVIKIS